MGRPKYFKLPRIAKMSVSEGMVVDLQRMYKPVFRMRISDESVKFKRDTKTGEVLWNVGNRVMLESEVKALHRKLVGDAK